MRSAIAFLPTVSVRVLRGAARLGDLLGVLHEVREALRPQLRSVGPRDEVRRVLVVGEQDAQAHRLGLDERPLVVVEPLVQLGDGPVLRVLESLERWLYRSASGIVVNTRTFRDHITQRGVAPEDIELIYNGIDPSRFRPRPKNEALLAEHDLAGCFTVAYVGTLGLAHGLTLLIDVAERMKTRPELRFVLIGDGADREKLEADVAGRGLSNVKMLGLQPREAMPDWIASIDLLLVTLRDLPVFETVIPSKIFEFLAQERPVILAARGEIRRMMQEAGGALVIDPEVEDQLVGAIEEVIAHPEEAAARAAAGRRWVEQGFIRDDLARQMARFLERIFEEAARAGKTRGL